MTGGRGPLTLNGANTYSGGTTVNVFSLTRRRGTLIVRNRTGSGTGSGPVTVVQGLLGGSGTIKGAVSLTGLSQIQPGILAPAAGGRIASTLTIKNLLTFGSSGGLFNPLIQSTANKTRIDRVNARGVTIGSGAQFALLANQLQSTLEVGASFTLISNTSANPINGTFGNLPDGAIVTVNGNNFQASYEGGDGNDLTLTVIP